MIPFGLFTRVILDSGIVRIHFNNVTWVDNGDGTWSYTIPRNVHMSGSYPKTILVDNSNQKINLVAKEYLNDQVKLIAYTPYTDFICYFMGDETEIGGSLVKRILNITTQRSVASDVSVFYDPETKGCFFAGRKSYFALGSGYTNGWVDISSLFTIPIKQVCICGNGQLQSNNSNLTTFVLLDDGTVQACGNNDFYQITNQYHSYYTSFIDIGVTNVKKIAAGSKHTVILFNDGTVKTRGYNAYGQIGNGLTSQATEWFTLATNCEDIDAQNTTTYIKIGGVWHATGKNYGQLGIDTATQPKTPIPIGVNEQIVDIYPCFATGLYAISSNGTIYYSGEETLKPPITTFTQISGVNSGIIVDSIQSDDIGSIMKSIDGRVFYAGGDSAANSTYTTPNLTVFSEVTDKIGNQQSVCRTTQGTFIFDGVAIQFTGDNSAKVTGTTTPRYQTFTQLSDIPFNL